MVAPEVEVEAMESLAPGVDSYLLREDFEGKGAEGGDGDNGHRHQHHRHNDNDDNDRRRLSVEEALCARDGKGKRKTTSYLHGIHLYYGCCMCPPPTHDVCPNDSMVGVRQTGGGGAKTNTKEELKWLRIK